LELVRTGWVGGFEDDEASRSFVVVFVSSRLAVEGRGMRSGAVGEVAP